MITDTVWINGLTQDLVLDSNNQYVKKNPLLTECYTRFITPLGSWVIDPTFGSMFPLWINTRTQLTTNKCLQELNRIYQPVIINNRALSIVSKIITLSSNFSSIGILVTITDLSQKTLTLNLNL